MKEVDKKRINKRAKLLYKKWKSIKNKSKFIENYQYIKHHLDFVFSYEFIFLTLLYYETFRKIIQNHNIDLIFLTGGGTIIDRCALAAAETENIYSMFNPHGYMSTIGSDWGFLKKAKFIVFGKDQEDDLIKRKTPKNNIKKTGALVLDDLGDYIKNIKSKNQKIKKSKIKQKKILFLTQAAVEKKLIDKKTYFNFIKTTLESLSTLQNASITVKMHPAEKYHKKYKKITTSIKNKNIEVTKTKNTNELIQESDLVITFRSSVILNSIAMNKPVICPDLIDKTIDTSYDLSRENKALLITNYNSNISKIVGDVLNNKKTLKEVLDKQKKYLNYFLVAVDGKAYERIAEFIYDLT